MTNSSNKSSREFFGLFFIFSAILLLFSLATYDPRDPSLNHVVRGTVQVQNLAGMFGAYLSALFVDMLGFAAYIPVAFLACLGAKRTLNAEEWHWWRWLSFLSGGCALAVAGAAWGIGLGAVRDGGLLGDVLYQFFLRYFNPWGTGFIWIFIFFISLQTLFGISWLRIFQAFLRKSYSAARQQASAWMSRQKELKERRQQAQPPLTVSTERSGKPELKSEKQEAGNRLSKDNCLPNNRHPGASSSMPNATSKNAPATAAVHPAVENAQVKITYDTLGALPAEAPLMNNQAEPAPAKLPPWSKLSLAPENSAEDDLPPWVEDLEAGRIGLNNTSKTTSPETRPNPPQAKQTIAAQEKTAVDKQPQASHIIIDEAPKPIPSGLLQEELKKSPARLPLPGLDLLSSGTGTNGGASREELEGKGRTLMNCLADFGIQGELARITPGPVVTMFEVRPAPGVKVSRIASLSDDLALSLKSIAVRVQAPIPGTDAVGIEIPNDKRETVALKELFSSAAFQHQESLLTMGLGKDIAGGPAVADLTRMPHLLVAGATGAGKSVCLNSILLSFLYKARPHEVKLLLIDPKRIEMAIYADLPHLVHPVVTEMALAKNALDWAVAEMDRRYTNIARLGVRNVSTYNEKLAALRASSMPDELADLAPMPYLVIIIDELADLMLTAAKEVETSIVRLAQLARAAGIHLILATQRPSVDVVTGLIKANFPCRISFQVTSKHDSRTILDTVGAENLLGKGDMLFKPAGGRFQRLHGAFVSDEEVSAVVAYWKKQQKPSYAIDFSEWGADQQGDVSPAGVSDVASDPIYGDAVEFVMQQGQASISLIQRRFRIGFNRAARFVEQMEQDGIISPPDGSKPRKVIR